MKKLTINKKDILIKLGITILMILCIFSFIWFITSFRQFYENGDFRINNHYPRPLKNTPRVDIINTWMTFDYINVAYNLPLDYIRKTLSINDPRYPNVKIGHYIKRNNVSPQVFINELKKSIISYSQAK